MAFALAAQQRRSGGVRLRFKLCMRLQPPLQLRGIQLLSEAQAKVGEVIRAHVHVGLIQR